MPGMESYIATFADRFPGEFAFEAAPDWNWYSNQVLLYQQSQSWGYPAPDTFADRFNAVYDPILPFGEDAAYLRSEMVGAGAWGDSLFYW
jgi:hypothetical protein